MPTGPRYAAEYPNLWVPSTTQGQTTQILIVLQLCVSANVAGEWTVSVTLRPGSQPGEPHTLPPARVAAVRQSWLPVVTGQNPKTTYDTADRMDERPPDRILDFLIQQSNDGRYAAMMPAKARVLFAAQQAQGRERSYKTWLHDVIQRQKSLAPAGCSITPLSHRTSPSYATANRQRSISAARIWKAGCARWPAMAAKYACGPRGK